MIDQKRIDKLEAMVRELKQRTSNLPARWGKTKSGFRYHSHQAKTNTSTAPGATEQVSLYIEGADTGEDVDATVCPTIQETIDSGTWIRLNWTPTSDGAGRWEIVGYDCS